MELFGGKFNRANKRTAFTLAEVLITLGVIGVVAALTLPVLITKYQKQQTVTQLKKAYTEINQAIKLSELENGEITNWHVEDNLEAQHNFARNYIIKYFKTAKVCIPSNSDCFEANAIDKYFSFITVSGYSVMGWTHSAGNGGWLYIDINGPKKGANKMGKDIFPLVMQFDDVYDINSLENNRVVDKPGVFMLGLGLNSPLTRDELINGGGNVPGGFANGLCNKDSGMGTCGALIVNDGWQIKDDYPW